jgi:hypothetical protein
MRPAMFSQKTSPNLSLLKLFVTPNQGCSASEFANAVLKMQSGLPLKATLNYGPEVAWSSLAERLARTSLAAVEHLLVLGSDSEVMVSLSLEREVEGLPAQFSCMVVTQESIERLGEGDPFAHARSVGTVEYGYARALSPDMSPVSETKVKRSLFGTVSVTVPPRRSDWLCKSEPVVHGAIKGLYPINYWNERVHAVVRTEHIVLPHELPKHGLVKFSQYQLKQAQIDNPQCSRYVHF